MLLTRRCVLLLAVLSVSTAVKANYVMHKPPPLPKRCTSKMPRGDGAESGRRRALLTVFDSTETSVATTSSSKCSWNVGADKQCSLSTAGIGNLFRQSDNDYTRFSARAWVCLANNDQSSCHTHAFCVWDKELNVCLFYDFSYKNERSPCVKSSGTIQLAAREGVCESKTSANGCRDTSLCYWDADDKECSGDVFDALYGIPTEFLLEMTTVLATRWAKVFISEFNTDDPNFDYANILQWEVPDVRCPRFSSKKECKLGKATAVFIPQILYCALKYNTTESAKYCNLDPLCEYDITSGSCDARTTNANVIAYYEKTIHLINKPFDRQLISKVIGCLALSQDFCTGQCIWDATDSSCTLKAGAAYGDLVAKNKNRDDVVCTYISDIVQSGCVDINDFSTCEAADNCFWSSIDDGICGISIGYLLRQVLQRDMAAATSISAAETVCNAFDTQEACSRV